MYKKGQTLTYRWKPRCFRLVAEHDGHSHGHGHNVVLEYFADSASARRKGRIVVAGVFDIPNRGGDARHRPAGVGRPAAMRGLNTLKSHHKCRRLKEMPPNSEKIILNRQHGRSAPKGGASHTAAARVRAASAAGVPLRARAASRVARTSDGSTSVNGAVWLRESGCVSSTSQ